MKRRPAKRTTRAPSFPGPVRGMLAGQARQHRLEAAECAHVSLGQAELHGGGRARESARKKQRRWPLRLAWYCHPPFALVHPSSNRMPSSRDQELAKQRKQSTSRAAALPLLLLTFNAVQFGHGVLLLYRAPRHRAKSVRPQNIPSLPSYSPSPHPLARASRRRCRRRPP